MAMLRELLTTPLGWILCLGVAISLGRFVAVRRGRRAQAFPASRSFFWPFFILWLATIGLATPLAARWLAGPLEEPTPRDEVPAWAAMEPPDVIVALGGGIEGAARPGVRLSPASTERLHETLVAARVWPEIPVLFSGGMGSREVTSATRMAEEAIRLGLDAERVIVERESQTTRENALYCARQLSGRGLSRPALVTSAIHMRRARAAFLGEGVDPLPIPVAGATTDGFELGLLLPDARALSRSSQAIHEWLGLAWYRLRGWLD